MAWNERCDCCGGTLGENAVWLTQESKVLKFCSHTCAERYNVELLAL